MTTYQGAKHWLGFKPQASAGTPETTVTNFLVTSTIAPNHGTSRIGRKTSAATGLRLPSRDGLISPTGSATFELLASQPQPWYWILGDNTTTTVTTGVYKHVIVPHADGPALLTCEADWVAGKVRQNDAKLSKLTATFTPGEIAEAQVEWMSCWHDDSPTITSTPAFLTDTLVVREAAVSIAGSPDTTVDQIEIEIDPMLEQKPALVTVANAPGMVRVKEPLKITGKISFIDYPTAELARLVAASTFGLIVTLTGDNISGNYDKYLKITLPACQYTGGLDTEAAGESLTGEATFEAFYDTVSSKQIEVEAQNAISNIEG